MKRSEVTLNDKGLTLIAIIIGCLIFALGFMMADNRKRDEITVFTKDDLERIVKFQEMEDETESGAEIYAKKDEDGNLMIGWKVNEESKWGF